MIKPSVSDFGTILIFLFGGLAFAMIGLVTAKLIRPNRPNYEKLTTYESGEDTIGSAWGKSNIRFYVVALIFLLFEVEIIYLFPWSTIFGDSALVEETEGKWVWFAITEMFAFILILALGLAYAWRKEYLNWVKPMSKTSNYKSKIPSSAYDKFK